MSVDVLERTEAPTADERVFVMLTVAGQTCGVPVGSVRDILGEQAITRIPLAPPEIAGSLNLRGRIVTAVDLRRRLNLPPPPEGRREPYRRLATEVDVEPDLDRAFASAAEFLDPVLAGRADGVWNPQRRTWA